MQLRAWVPDMAGGGEVLMYVSCPLYFTLVVSGVGHKHQRLRIERWKFLRQGYDVGQRIIIRCSRVKLVMVSQACPWGLGLHGTSMFSLSHPWTGIFGTSFQFCCFNTLFNWRKSEAKKVSTNESTSAPFRPNTNFHVLREGSIDDACDCNHTGRDFRVIYWLDGKHA